MIDRNETTCRRRAFLLLRMKFTGPFPGKRSGLTPRKFRRMQKLAWKAMGDYWHEKIRPLHFTVAGAKKYRYKRRTLKYRKAKLAKFGHNKPLVWSGESRRLTANRNVTSTSRGMRVKMGQAKALNFRRRRKFTGVTINMRDELLRTRADERRQMAKVFTRRIERLLKRIRTTRIVRS